MATMASMPTSDMLKSFKLKTKQQELLIRVSILCLVYILAFITRLLSVLQYESTIHEFDQYYVSFQTETFGRLRVPDSAKFIQLESDGHLKAYLDGLITSEATYFKPINLTNIDLRCYAISQISCELPHHHSFLQLSGKYFQSVYNLAFSDTITEDDCKEACLKNCSCKAVLYRKGYCHFLSQVLSIKKINSGDPAASDHSYSAFTLIKTRLQLF